MHTLTFISQSIMDESTRGMEMRQLMTSCHQRNLRRGLTGVMFLRGNIFYQTLEGPKNEVQRVYSKIKSDKRHDSIYVVLDEPIEERRFPEWSMECFYQPECGDDLLATLERLGKHLTKHEEFSPSAVYNFSWKMVAELAAFRLSEASTKAAEQIQIRKAA